MIAVRDRLAMQRQIFFVATGGFDTHDNQVADQPGLLGNVSAVPRGVLRCDRRARRRAERHDFTQSDFGRTLTSNGDGTDHAWGGVQIVVGRRPSRPHACTAAIRACALNGPDDVGGGRMIPSVSADQYAATLASWFGIADADLPRVAPHIGNFAERDLGFMV